MKTIKLNNLHKVFFVDDEDFERCKSKTWYLSNEVNIKTFIGRESISIANFLMNTTNIEYDHKDRNPFNNSKENLRSCTQSQNAANRTKWVKNSSSQFKGVCWHKNAQKWEAYIKFKYKKIYIGCFNSEIAAAKAYNEKALKLFREFAVLNKFGE